MAEREPTNGADDGAGNRRISRLWLALSLAAAGWIVWDNRGDLSFFESASLGLIFAMVGLHAVSLLSQSERFRLVLQDHTGARFSIEDWLLLFVRGRLFSSVVPQAGNVYRGMALRQDHGTPVLQYLSTLATQTWMAVVTSLVIAALIGLIAASVDPGPTASGASLALSIAAISIGVAPLAATRLKRVVPLRVRQVKVVELAGRMLALATRSIQNVRLVASFVGLVMVGFIAAVAGLRIAFTFAGTEISWVAAATILAFVHVGNLVAITPGNLGVQEIGVAGLAAVFGYPLAAGVVASIVVRLSNVVALVLLGALAEVGSFLGKRLARGMGQP